MSGGVRYLLDTNVLSETRKTNADRKVLAFLGAADPESLFISVLAIGELRKGVAIKQRSDAETAARLGAWVDGIEQGFSDRVLPVDAATARLWGCLSADRTRPVIDTLMAATALVHQLVLVTRNAGDLRGLDLPALDPWTGRQINPTAK